jgi:hypothetical protein
MLSNSVTQEMIQFLLIFCCLLSQRYINGGRVLVIFQIVYLLLFFSINPTLNYSNIILAIIYPSCGIIIGLLFTIISFVVLPKMKITFAEVNKDSYIFKKSLCISVLVSAVYVLSRFLYIANPAWVCYSIIIISSGTYNISIKTSIQRLLGTIIGAIVGIFLAYFIFNKYHFTVYSCFIFIFLTYLFVNYNYGIAIGFATIWLITTFYFLNPHMTIVNFVLARVFDTALGITIGIAAELFITKKIDEGYHNNT